MVIALESGAAVMAGSSRLVYRRGEVDWSLASSGRGVVGKWLHRAQRRAAGMEARMSRYEGAGEVGFAPASPGAVTAVELRPGLADVVCQAESLVVVEAGIQADVALVRRIREAGSRTTLAMIRLTGEGVAFLCAHGAAVTVELEAGEPPGGRVVGGGVVRGDCRLPDADDGGWRDVPGHPDVGGRYQGPRSCATPPPAPIVHPPEASGMKHRNWCALVLFSAGLGCALWAASGCAPPDDGPRTRLLMDDGWRFFPGRAEGFVPLPRGNTIETWHQKLSEAGEAEAERMAAPGLDPSGWQEAEPGSDVFGGQPGLAWFRAELGALPPGPTGRPRIYFQSVDDNATVYLNGSRLVYHEGAEAPFEVSLDSGGAWNLGGPNALAVLVENTGGPGGIGPASVYNRPAFWEDDPSMRSAAAAAVDFDDSGWEEVRLPHDFVVGGEFDPKGADKPGGKRPGFNELWYDRDHGYKPKGVGWYRRSFELPAADRGKRIWLEFDGVYRNSDVWINGEWLGHHWSGYTGFHYDITDTANFGGRNVVTVRADADWDEGWWYEGGGIYRHVWLTKLDPLHVGRWGTFVTTPEVSEPSAEVHVETTVVNEGIEPVEATLTSAVIDREGSRIAAAAATESIPAGQELAFNQRVEILDPTRWSLDNPYLYTLETTVEAGGRVTDVYETPLGVRSFRFDGSGFFLNGKHVKINGANLHTDFAGVGVALPDRINAYRLEKLKEMGANAIRTAHNPPAAEVLDAADRLGMLVLVENRHMGTSEEVIGTVESMVRRDRNHPSVIGWSMNNEGLRQGYEVAGQQLRAMHRAIKRLDPTRPTTGNVGPLTGATSPDEIGTERDLITLADVIDVRGFDPKNYDDYHAANPDRPMLALETGYDLTTRGIYADDEAKGHHSSYDTSADETWRRIAETDYVAGGFVWNGMDYRGEPFPFDWPVITAQYGFMDTCAFPKDNYYYYQSSWSDETVLHLFPHWNEPPVAEDGTVKVRSFTNCESVELFLNGESQGRKEREPYSGLSWKVAWEPGALEAKCYRDGEVVAEARRETTGAPAAIALEPDRPTIDADGEDVSLVRVSIVDAEGRTVPTATNQVQFRLEGPGEIIGVGNGDPSSHEADKSIQRSAFNGLALVIVQAAQEPGVIRLTAESPGLETGSVQITAEEAALRPRVP